MRKTGATSASAPFTDVTAAASGGARPLDSRLAARVAASLSDASAASMCLRPVTRSVANLEVGFAEEVAGAAAKAAANSDPAFDASLPMTDSASTAAYWGPTNGTARAGPAIQSGPRSARVRSNAAPASRNEAAAEVASCAARWRAPASAAVLPVLAASATATVHHAPAATTTMTAAATATMIHRRLELHIRPA